MDKVEIIKILNQYQGHKHSFGKYCCNLMMLQIYEPEFYELIKGRYKTAIGGARVAKKLTGFVSIENMMKTRGYEMVPFEYCSFGDIVIEGTNIGICIGERVFSVDGDNIFTQLPLKHFRGVDVYRRVE